jgi:hypothetical protein
VVSLFLTVVLKYLEGELRGTEALPRKFVQYLWYLNVHNSKEKVNSLNILQNNSVANQTVSPTPKIMMHFQFGRLSKNSYPLAVLR